MSGIRNFIATHRFALKVLEAGEFDCAAYQIWLDEFDGRKKLASLDRMEPMVSADSSVNEYGELLVDQMNALLAEGCSEELLLATYEFCDRLFDMVTEELAAEPPIFIEVDDIVCDEPMVAENSNMALAA